MPTISITFTATEVKVGRFIGNGKRAARMIFLREDTHNNHRKAPGNQVLHRVSVGILFSAVQVLRADVVEATGLPEVSRTRELPGSGNRDALA